MPTYNERTSYYGNANPYEYKDNGIVYDNAVTPDYNVNVNRDSRYSARSQPVY